MTNRSATFFGTLAMLPSFQFLAIEKYKSRPISNLLTKATSLPTLLLTHPTLPAIPPESGNTQIDEGSQLQKNTMNSFLGDSGGDVNP